ncbi:hypothetical protein [Sporosarcina sp. Te-1]|uniref:hypothetical protein n=1 Tax=Sporosarcina sp. Te-1 TaxID=2818390 RepID=UPI001A9D0809|nr:hypothetical protein [Sporosarcina sp. Te-1]QTD42084.1 hypothetical protein J3U78_04420 [Sporosarcina sp. Te-1]
MNIKREFERSLPDSLILTEEEKRKIRTRINGESIVQIRYKPILVSVLSLLLLFIILAPALSMDRLITGSPIPLTATKKQQYYEQYLQIVEKAMEQKIGISIEVAPKESFKETDWVTPREYNNMIQAHVDSFLQEEKKVLASLPIEHAVMKSEGMASKKNIFILATW